MSLNPNALTPEMAENFTRATGGEGPMLHPSQIPTPPVASMSPKSGMVPVAKYGTAPSPIPPASQDPSLPPAAYMGPENTTAPAAPSPSPSPSPPSTVVGARPGPPLLGGIPHYWGTSPPGYTGPNIGQPTSWRFDPNSGNPHGPWIPHALPAVNNAPPPGSPMGPVQAGAPSHFQDTTVPSGSGEAPGGKPNITDPSALAMIMRPRGN